MKESSKFVCIFIKPALEMLGKWLTGGTWAILISNTARFCVTTSLGYDFSKLGVLPVRIVSTRNMD